MGFFLWGLWTGIPRGVNGLLLLLLASCIKSLLDCNGEGPAFISSLAAHFTEQLDKPESEIYFLEPIVKPLGKPCSLRLEELWFPEGRLGRLPREGERDTGQIKAPSVHVNLHSKGSVMWGRPSYINKMLSPARALASWLRCCLVSATHMQGGTWSAQVPDMAAAHTASRTPLAQGTPFMMCQSWVSPRLLPGPPHTVFPSLI